MWLAAAILAFGVTARLRTPQTVSQQTLEEQGDKAFRAYELEQARAYWLRAVDAETDRPAIYNKLAVSFMVAADYQGALAMTERGLRIEANHTALKFNQALACYHLDDCARGLKVLEQLIALNTEYPYPEAHALRGMCLEKLGHHANAQDAFVAEINANPGSRLAWKNLRKAKDEG